jgi:hypothetical protein
LFLNMFSVTCLIYAIGMIVYMFKYQMMSILYQDICESHSSL